MCLPSSGGVHPQITVRAPLLPSTLAPTKLAVLVAAGAEHLVVALTHSGKLRELSSSKSVVLKGLHHLKQKLF